MSLAECVESILSEPSSDGLWALHPYLLAIKSPEAESAREVARLFYCYLSCVSHKLTSKDLSSRAARFAAGSVGVIALTDVLNSLRSDRRGTINHLLSGGLAATLETLSTFQHVKAWGTEFASVHEDAVWHLYQLLWELSAETQPELPVERRDALINNLLSIVRKPEVAAGVRVAIVIRLFQILLVIRVAPLLHDAEKEAETAP